MIEINLYKCLHLAKIRDEPAIESLLDTFKPLLKKYGNLLNDDDAFYDLQAFFISLES